MSYTLFDRFSVGDNQDVRLCCFTLKKTTTTRSGINQGQNWMHDVPVCSRVLFSSVYLIRTNKLSRIRRIKCDEEKPSCLRCTSTGRSCDGYASHSVANDLVFQRALQPKGFRSKKEQHTFDYFCHYVVTGLMGYCGSNFWQHIVLQLSQASPAVMHAVLALGALHQDLNATGSKVIDNKDLFLVEYNKSIRYLRSIRGNTQLPVTLTCCILFIW
jgi:hypothetical protein